MSIVEVHGGPLTADKLEKKHRKSELATMYLNQLKMNGMLRERIAELEQELAQHWRRDSK